MEKRWDCPGAGEGKENGMDRIFSAVQEHLEAGEDAVLCRVVNTAGSTPRGPGARMAVFSSGSAQGTVGGGAVELADHRGGPAVPPPSPPRASASPQPGPRGRRGDIGMICGGEADSAPAAAHAGGRAADGGGRPGRRQRGERLAGDGVYRRRGLDHVRGPGGAGGAAPGPAGIPAGPAGPVRLSL